MVRPPAAIGAALAAVCATAAAQVDFLENLRVFTLLDTFPRGLYHGQRLAEETKQKVKDVRDAALFKFELFFVATALLSPVFLWRAGQRLFVVIGVLFLLAATVGLFGLWRYRLVVAWAFFLMTLGVLAIAVEFDRLPPVP